MKILAIETSCDETAIAVLEVTTPASPKAKQGGQAGDKKTFTRNNLRSNLGGPDFHILSNIISSQVSLHAEWGGVVPNIAKREHIKNLPIVYEQALKKSGIKESEIDVIAVTVGPGLEPALWTGINFAQNLTKVLGKPIVAVNHMEGHIYSVFLKDEKFTIPSIQNRSSRSHLSRRSAPPQGETFSRDFEFPAVALLVSGGHTEIVLIKDWMDYEIIGQTRDDAVGEAFDKVAKMLGLPYPGGPVIAAEAAKSPISNFQFPINDQILNDKNNKQQNKIKNSNIENSLKIDNCKLKIELPRPMLHSDDFDFSFSGLKTAVLYLIKNIKQSLGSEASKLSEETISAICAEFQQAAIDTLIFKTIKAAEKYKAKTIILGGGVSANEKLKTELEEAVQKNLPCSMLHVPCSMFSGDNAAMIAVAAYFHAIKKEFVKNPEEIMAEGNLSL